MANKEEYFKRLDEIKELYDVSEIEMSVVNQYIGLISMMQHSRKLSLRMLKIVVALLEVLPEEPK